MSKKPQRIFALLMSIMLLCALLPTTALAAGEISTAQPASLTIDYKDGSKAISNADFSIYKVADVDEYGGMTLTPAFAAYKSTVSGLGNLDNLTQEQWLSLAATLNGYVQKDNINPVAKGKTDSNGKFTFSNLKVGLYLVLGSRTTTSDNYIYSAVPFMVFIPGQDLANNDWNYDVTAAPKYTKEMNPPEEEYVSRKVLKKWDDAGYESLRPKEVTVQLLKDGKVYDTQTLNKDNNWRYTWDKLSAKSEWTIVEKEIEGYAVSITRSGITFTVTNKYVIPITGANLPIQKRIIGDTPKTTSVFKFTFSALDASYPMPEDCNGTKKEISIIGAGSKEIGNITFDKPGTYVYTVSEQNSGAEGYTYDSTVYTVTYVVTEKDGKLFVSRTIKDQTGKTVSAVEFTNPYKTPGNKLPQTGVMWWPVPLLTCAGLVFIMIGVLRRRRYN